jgi:hypothetical protein
MTQIDAKGQRQIGSLLDAKHPTSLLITGRNSVTADSAIKQHAKQQAVFLMKQD